MGVASGCGEQEVGVASGSGWNLWVWLLGLWVWLLGVATGCGCKEVYRFPHTPLVFVPFCSSIPTFCSFLKMFLINKHQLKCKH